jgi:aminomuconate-semialdehyde/2-hydroxymuconate-6-semialdehyde dehydrogenase
MQKIQHFINGRYCDAVSGNWIDNIEPATGKVFSHIADGDERDVEAAYQAAAKAFPAWAATPIEERSAILLKLADLIEANMDALVLAESTDNGKPLKLARRMDIPRAASNFRYFGNAITQYHSETYDMGESGFNYTLRRPIGVVGCISPWNLPLYLYSWKVAPAIAAGNTVVSKPSELTPLTAALLGDLCNQAGLPPGVLNIVHGYGAKTGAAIVAHPNITAISFTGGTATGKVLAATAAPMFKKLSLELGGKNPTVIFADCDFEKTVKGTAVASFTNQGQICLCGSRILVERSIYDKYVSAFVAEVKAMKVGDPLDDDTRIGAIVSKAQFEKDLSYIALAKEEGGTILLGGKPAAAPNARCADGYFLEPTIITGLTQQCRTNQEEIFGPIVTIQPFDTEEEAIAAANSTMYGLSATLWTENLRRAHRVAAALESGIVWINSWLVRDLRTPFGGVKASGVGREGGYEALDFFTEAKNVFVQL